MSCTNVRHLEIQIFTKNKEKTPPSHNYVQAFPVTAATFLILFLPSAWKHNIYLVKLIETLMSAHETVKEGVLILKRHPLSTSSMQLEPTDRLSG